VHNLDITRALLKTDTFSPYEHFAKAVTAQHVSIFDAPWL